MGEDQVRGTIKARLGTRVRALQNCLKFTTCGAVILAGGLDSDFTMGELDAYISTGLGTAQAYCHCRQALLPLSSGSKRALVLADYLRCASAVAGTIGATYVNNKALGSNYPPTFTLPDHAKVIPRSPLQQVRIK
jgi:hypothetical protein